MKTKRKKAWTFLRVPEPTRLLWKSLAEEMGVPISHLLETVALDLAKKLNSDNPKKEEGEPEK